MSEAVELSPRAAAAMRWARAHVAANAAVLDTETTDLFGAIVEIAVVAASGEVLLDTLVRPDVPITSEAYRVHGIGEADVATAPSWIEVWPRVLAVTTGKSVLAYHAAYDAQVIVAECERYGLDPSHLGQQDTWGCLMEARCDHLDLDHRIALGGGHRACGDALAARAVLHELTSPPTRGFVTRTERPALPG